MTYWPALEEFERECDTHDVHDSIKRVYRKLRSTHLLLWEHRPLKVSTMADAMRMNRDRAGKAIEWLLERRYLHQLKREGKIRWLILVWDRGAFPSNGEKSAA